MELAINVIKYEINKNINLDNYNFPSESSDKILNEVSSRMEEISKINNQVENKEEIYWEILQRVENRRKSLENKKKEVEENLNITDGALQNIYKDFLMTAKNTLDSIEQEESQDEETGNLFIHMNLLRELIEGKAFEVNSQEHELNEREIKLNEMLSLLSPEDLEKFKNLCNNCYDNCAYDTETQMNLNKTKEVFDKISDINFGGYFDEIQTAIHNLSQSKNGKISEIPVKKIETVNKNKHSLGVNFNPNKKFNHKKSKSQNLSRNMNDINNSFIVTEKEHDMNMLQNNADEILLNDNGEEIKVTFSPEVIPQNVVIYDFNKLTPSNSNLHIKPKSHTRSTSMTTLTNKNEEVIDNKTVKKSKFGRNSSTPSITNKPIKDKTITSKPVVTKKNSGFQPKYSYRANLEKNQNNMNSKLNNNFNNTKGSIKNLEVDNKIKMVNSILIIKLK